MTDNAAARYLRLREIPGEEIEFVYECDRYDGPISGLVRHQAKLLWFEWDSDHEPDPRRYFLHAVPAADQTTIDAWLRRNETLSNEFYLVANPHAWPVSARQQATFRPMADIQADLQAHSEERPRWEDLPPIAWFTESGQAFAAIQTYTLTQVDSEAFDAWQLAVARALAAEDQPALDRLFPNQPGPRDPLDLYLVTRPGSQDEPVARIVRDWRGQPLSEDFLMTAKHRVQNFDGLLAREPGVDPR